MIDKSPGPGPQYKIQGHKIDKSPGPGPQYKIQGHMIDKSPGPGLYSNRPIGHPSTVKSRHFKKSTF